MRVADGCGEAALAQALGYRAREYGRAMAPAGASESHGQIALALAPVERNQEVEDAAGLVDKSPDAATSMN